MTTLRQLLEQIARLVQCCHPLFQNSAAETSQLLRSEPYCSCKSVIQTGTSQGTVSLRAPMAGTLAGKN